MESNLINRSELRRLQKAARDNNKTALSDWAYQFEQQIRYELKQEYEKFYKGVLSESIDNLLVALTYTIVYSDNINIDLDDVPQLLNDIFATIDFYRTGEFKPDDYRKKLAEVGIFLNNVNYSENHKEDLDNSSDNDENEK